MSRTRNSVEPVVEKKPAKPTISVQPTVRLHPSVDANSCGKCTFLDRDARYCELLDEPLKLLPARVLFQRHARCLASEVVGGVS